MIREVLEVGQQFLAIGSMDVVGQAGRSGGKFLVVFKVAYV